MFLMKFFKAYTTQNPDIAESPVIMTSKSDFFFFFLMRQVYCEDVYFIQLL